MNDKILNNKQQSKFIAILIDGDIENSLGGACSRDIWNISKKLLNDGVV